MVVDSPLPSEYGFDEYGAFNCAGEQMPVHEDARHAISFIEKSVESKKPFFINLWLHEPHTPFHTVPKYRWRFRELEEPDNIYASVLSHADDRVGDVLAALDRLKLTENTLVIFSSDNGPARASRPTELTLTHDTATGAGYGIGGARGITGGRKGYKGALFEGGVGVPFIARWPGKIAANKVDETSLFSAVDLLPTFCELAKVELPADYKPDGLSQVQTLLGKGMSERSKPLFWKMASRWPPQKTRPYHWVSYAVVDQNWKLLTNRDQSHVELFDLSADRFEATEISDANPDVLKELLGKLTAWQETLPLKPTGDVFSKKRATIEN